MPGSKSHEAVSPDEDVEVHEVNYDEPATPEEKSTASGRNLNGDGTKTRFSIVNNTVPVRRRRRQPQESLWEKRAKSAVAVVMVFGAFWMLFQDQRTSLREQAATAKEQAATQATQLQSVLASRDAATSVALQKSEAAAADAWKRRSEERAEALKHANEFMAEHRRVSDKLDVLIEITRGKPKTTPSKPAASAPANDSGIAPWPREAT